MYICARGGGPWEVGGLEDQLDSCSCRIMLHLLETCSFSQLATFCLALWAFFPYLLEASDLPHMSEAVYLGLVRF